MDVFSTITEVGILETNLVISRNPKCTAEISAYIPIVSNQYVEMRIQELTDAVIKTNKEQLFLMSPEIAILEALVRLRWKGKAILAIPFDLNSESQERILANIPEGICADFVYEGIYPANFRPNNGAIICTGIVPNGYRSYVLPASCRMMSLYKTFQGQRILLSCFPSSVKVPEIGWAYTDSDFFNCIIQEAEDECLVV
jgi:hypothetical protein